MSFIQNLIKKIKIKQLSDKVRTTIGPPGSMKKVDKEAMIKLLEYGNYHKKRERDLDLFLKEDTTDKTRIIVLDNELAIYNTTIYDVAMRKSPLVKEMVRLKNIRKIMNDTDVVLSRREDSVNTIEKECIDALDLSFNHTDLDEIAENGISALNSSDSEGVIQSLTLFAELLGYKPPPKILKSDAHYIIGTLNKNEDNTIQYGPITVYSIADNLLQLLNEKVSTADNDKVEQVRAVFQGKQKAPIQGPDVFLFLNKASKQLSMHQPITPKPGATS